MRIFSADPATGTSAGRAATLGRILTRDRHHQATIAAALCALAIAGCGTQSASSASSAQDHGATHRRAARASRPIDVKHAYRPLYQLPAPVQDPASAPLDGTSFVLAGGITAADTSTDQVIVANEHKSQVKASLPNAQHDAQAAKLDGQVYVFGGGQFSQYDHILAFNPASGAVTTTGALPRAASDVAVAAGGGTAYIVGGFDGVNWLDTVLAYSPGGAVRVLAHLPVALRYAAAAVVDGELLVAGGSTETGVSKAIYKIDPASAAVSTLGHLPSGVTHAAAGVLGHTMYLVGGRGDLVSDRTANVLAIDALTGKVRKAGRLPQPLSDAAVVSLPGRLIVAGGVSAAGTQAAVGELVARR
jgi:hypothetical protein